MITMCAPMESNVPFGLRKAIWQKSSYCSVEP